MKQCRNTLKSGRGVKEGILKKYRFISRSVIELVRPFFLSADGKSPVELVVDDL